MFKRSARLASTSNKRVRLNSIENYAPSNYRSVQSICLQTDPIEMCTKKTNTPNYLDDMLKQGETMSDNEFELFIKGTSLP
jgi:hypothetical protein